jgi:hypothetical protein
MPEEPALSSEENELMESLAGLTPMPNDVSEQTIWFEAGRRAGRRQSRVWMGGAAAAVVLSLAMTLMRPKPATVYVERAPVPQSRQTDRVVVAMPRSSLNVGAFDYVRLRDAVEQRGMDALSEPAGAGAPYQPTQRAWSPQGTASVPSPWDSLNTKG